MTWMIRASLRTTALFCGMFPLTLLAAAAASWLLSYILSLQYGTLASQRAAFGYYQDTVSMYAIWLIPCAATLALLISLRIATRATCKSSSVSGAIHSHQVQPLNVSIELTTTSAD